MKLIKKVIKKYQKWRVKNRIRKILKGYLKFLELLSKNHSDWSLETPTCKILFKNDTITISLLMPDGTKFTDCNSDAQKTINDILSALDKYDSESLLKWLKLIEISLPAIVVPS
jgi:hypothetical protein